MTPQEDVAVTLGEGELIRRGIRGSMHAQWEAEKALDRLEQRLARSERLNGELRRVFRLRMREWRDHVGERYGYPEEDVEIWLLDAERVAAAEAEGNVG